MRAPLIRLSILTVMTNYSQDRFLLTRHLVRWSWAGGIHREMGALVVAAELGSEWRQISRKHCSLASRWLKRDESSMLEGITENGLSHASVIPSIRSPYERCRRTEREMKYKHTVLSVYRRRSNLLQRTEGGTRSNLALRKCMLESQAVPGT